MTDTSSDRSAPATALAGRDRLRRLTEGAKTLGVIKAAFDAGIVDLLRSPRTAEDIRAVAPDVDGVVVARVLALLSSADILARDDQGRYTLTSDLAALNDGVIGLDLDAVVSEALLEVTRSPHVLDRPRYPAGDAALMLALISGGRPVPAMLGLLDAAYTAVPAFRERLEAGGPFLDAGAGIGGNLLAAATLFPELRATGVESDAAVAQELRARVAASDLAGRVTVHHGDIREVELSGFTAAYWAQTFFPAETACNVDDTGCQRCPSPVEKAAFMKIFVTGASGHIASAVIPELVAHGHQVVGLARSEGSAAVVAGLGAEVQRGDLADLDVLTAAAGRTDGVVHLAFDHTRMNSGAFDEALAMDTAALEALAGPLSGSDRPLVGTSATLTLAMNGITGRPGTEADALAGGPRAESENYVIGLADRGVRSSIVRVPPLVHSDLDHHGFTPTLIGMARQHQAAAYVGDGQNRWPAVDTRDLAALFRLAVEKAPAGSRLHGAGDEAITFRTIAETIGEQITVPAISVQPGQAAEYLGFLADFAQLDGAVSSAATRDLLGWRPTRPSWVDDVRSGRYLQ